MEGHTQLYRFTGQDWGKLNNLEIDYCEKGNGAVIRCKVWMHFDREHLQKLIATLEHVRDHHIKQSEDAPQNARDSIGVDNKPPDNVA